MLTRCFWFSNMIKKILRSIPFIIVILMIFSDLGAVEKHIGRHQASFNRDAYQHFLRGLIFEQEGKYQEALDEYRDTVTLDPQAAYVHKSLSTLNMKIGRLEDAIQSTKKLLEIDPSNADAHFLMGSIYLLQGEIPAAKKSFNRVLELDSDNKDALLYLAGLAAENNPEQAVRYLNRYLEADPNAPDIYYELGVIFSEKKKGHKRAIEYFTKAVELDPEFFNAHIALGRLYENEKEYRQSIDHYHKALDLKPDNTMLQSHLGLLYLQVGEIKKAEELYKKASEDYPEDPMFMLWLGIIAEQGEKWPKAVSYLTETIKKDADVTSLLRLSYYYIQKGNTKKALELLQQAKEIEPDDTQIRLFIAYGLRELGMDDDARTELEEILALDQDNSEALFQLGTMYEQAGAFHQAIPYFTHLLKRKPDHASTANYLGYSFADRDIRIAEAEDLVRTALK
ncbi:MAG: tetratricopeptide repeat protein, partial [Elusimicrobia bacterium]|nr:tetratricopeptide repeat protein [Elusimicrobiota bacterium]MBD3412217.1 tetratricopeptide repeat protein [Elusimicrobiota bacterium]